MRTAPAAAGATIPRRDAAAAFPPEVAHSAATLTGACEAAGWPRAVALRRAALATPVDAQQRRRRGNSRAACRSGRRRPILQTDVAAAGAHREAAAAESERQQRRRVLDGLIEERLRIHEVERYGFEQVPVELIAKQVAAIRARFPSEDAFHQRLKQLGMQLDGLEQLVAQQLQVMVYVDELLGARVFVGLEEIERTPGRGAQMRGAGSRCRRSTRCGSRSGGSAAQQQEGQRWTAAAAQRRRRGILRNGRSERCAKSASGRGRKRSTTRLEQRASSPN